MKKTLVAILTIALMSSCSKEQLGAKCNCGKITSDNSADYSVTIRNDCSGNSRTFNLTPGDWMTAYVGSNYCISNVTNW